VWDVASASLQRELEVPPRPEEGLLQWGLGWSLSPDSTMVALGFADRTVRVLDLDGARAPLVLRGHLHNPFALAFSPDSRALATSTLFARLLAKTEGLRRERGDFDFTIRVWPIPERRAARFSAFSTRTVEADLKWISDDPWTADGRALIVVEGLTVRVLTPEGGLAASVTIPAHHRFIKHSVATDDGRYALLETARHWLRLELRAPSRLESFEKPPAQQHDETMTKEHIRGWSGVSSDGALVFDVSQARDRVAIYRLETGELLRELEPGAELEHASFSPGGDRVLTLAKDRRARVWSVAGDAAARSIELAGEGYQDARWIRGGDAVFLVSYPGGASARREHRVWRLDAGEVELRASVAGPNFPPVVTADGQRAALIDSEFRIQISTNFGARETVTLERVDSELGRMAFSPDGAWLISRATNAAYIWSTTTGELVRVLRSRDRRLTLAIFDPTGTRALLAARDGSLTVHPFDAEEARASLRERLRDATSYCYSYKRRRVDLNETPARAWATFAACERAYGRDPGERPEDE
ncbi:MAG: hypothetical protein KC468_21440, partial [Myxococcales bacterium]|nr:hypothetical protein [Myxococcales bacterium]